MVRKLIIFALLIITQNSFSQWSTSTYAESALYVCPGFEPRILSLPDGSSYIGGGLSSSIYVQKLDPYGYKLWQQPVQVFNTPGTGNDEGVFDMVYDGEGGIVFVWEDIRGAYITETGFHNNAVYMQRVDSEGNIRWQTNGVQIAPVDGELKKASVFNDGTGGVIVALSESDFDRPTSPKKEWMWIRRYNKNGAMMWSYLLDSSTIKSQIYPPSHVVRLDSITRFGIRDNVKFIHNNGTFVDSLKYIAKGNIYGISNTGAFEFIHLQGENDSLGNSYIRTKITSLSNSWDINWLFEYKRIYEPANQFGKVENSVLSDGQNGIFLSTNFQSQLGEIISYIQNITPLGNRWSQNGNNGLRFTQIPIQSLFAGNNEVGAYFGNGTANKFDLNCNSLWHDSIVVLSNSTDAYFKVFASDNNGGCIVAFWTTKGGIYAQHTGRTGKLGVITNIKDISYMNPERFELYQNYPNPFNPSTTIRFSIHKESRVKIIIYDVLGKEIDVLVNGNFSKGEYDIKWDANTSAGGIYFCCLYIDNNLISTKKLIFLK